ncbi:integrase [Campylobacter pinnipediorum subsp. pinnipediorum]|uniref:Integrase n=1 Tax=Campylobacter pinnipediorum subsp. pinnipediorum TaxID=1660067 RepID=A0AAX0LAY8_9BACT|nr:site-specific integrase [Campylobacter pinnipediorum]OPA78808.1 integrase [Campylobacter pinnipediorum subsp. pinnipediorum]
MPKIANSLTAIAIKNLKPKDKPYFVSDGFNMLLKVSVNGNKSFILTYKSPKTNKQRRYTIGTYPTMSLSEAREKRIELQKQIANGIDILEQENYKDFQTIYQEYIKTRTEITPKHLQRISSIFNRFILPKFANANIKNITRKEIVDALILLQDKQATLKKSLNALNHFYKYALLHEYTNHNIITDIDKKTLIGKMEVRHYVFLKDDQDISKLLRNIREYSGDDRIKVCALLQLYTAVRGANARFAEWSEFDFDKSLWSISAQKMKAGKAHEVHLTNSIKNILLDYRQKYSFNSKYLFPSLRTTLKPISDNTVRTMLRNLGYSNEQITPHGFRATFSTICHENIDIHKHSSDVIELCLAHIETNKVKDAYNHAKNLKQRASLLKWWSDYLDNLYSPDM